MIQNEDFDPQYVLEGSFFFHQGASSLSLSSALDLEKKIK